MLAKKPTLHPLLRDFDEALGSPPNQMLEHLLRDIEKEGLIEEAWARLRRSPRARDAAWTASRKRLEIRAGVARARRQQREQLDSERCLLRIRYARGGALKDLQPPAFHGLMLRTLEDSGLRVALSLEKSPKPMLTFGHPLPLGAAGHGEWVDAILSGPPAAGWIEAAGAAAPEGLSFLEGTVLPPYAQSALELSRASQWFWPCPSNLRLEAEAKVAAFLDAASFEIEKGGKVAGQKTTKRVDIRGLVATMAWEAEGLAFTTRIRAGEAMNPGRLLAGVLGQESSVFSGLERRAVELAPDPRLNQQDRFAPKLKNIFEDAVLLGAGGNITLVDEDEDEPLQLG